MKLKVMDYAINEGELLNEVYMTIEKALPEAPFNVKVVSFSSGKIKLTWDAVDTESNNEEI